MRSFKDLSPREVLALAIHVERANARKFRAFADAFRGHQDTVADRFDELAVEEENHEATLRRTFEEQFDADIPKVEEADVAEVIESPDLDDAETFIFDSMAPQRVYELALDAEEGARRFYQRAAEAASDQKLAELYRTLSDSEDDHVKWLRAKLANPPVVRLASPVRPVASPGNHALEEETDYLYCPVCKVHIPCHRVPSGGWEVECPGCAGECGFCDCYMQRFCFGSRDRFPPFDSDREPFRLRVRK
jgi:rubrerythrin